MKLKTYLTITTVAAVVGVTAWAQPAEEIVTTVVADLTVQGYTDIEVELEAGGFEVEAMKGAAEVELAYDADGNLLEEEITENGQEIERTYDSAGNLLEEEIEAGDDDDADDDNDDDAEDDDKEDAGN